MVVLPLILHRTTRINYDRHASFVAPQQKSWHPSVSSSSVDTHHPSIRPPPKRRETAAGEQEVNNVLAGEGNRGLRWRNRDVLISRIPMSPLSGHQRQRSARLTRDAAGERRESPFSSSRVLAGSSCRVSCSRVSSHHQHHILIASECTLSGESVCSYQWSPHNLLITRDRCATLD